MGSMTEAISPCSAVADPSTGSCTLGLGRPSAFMSVLILGQPLVTTPVAAVAPQLHLLSTSVAPPCTFWEYTSSISHIGGLTWYTPIGIFLLGIYY